MTPGITIGRMHEDDFDDIIRIEQLAFKSYNLPPRTRKNIAYSYSLNPTGCFTAKNNGTPVGFIFSRVWGSIGWIGTFGIDEDFRGKGIGKQLLRAALTNLKENEKCRVIGLETMAESGYNIGLYLKEGFTIITPTLIVEKEVSDDRKRYPEIVPSSAGDWMVQITDEIIEGFDITSEADADTVIIPIEDSGIRMGFALVRVHRIREGYANDGAYVKALIMKDKSESSFSKAIEQVEQYCSQKGFKKVTIPVNLANTPVDAWLIKKEYRVSRIAIRMVFGDRGYSMKTGIELLRWIM